MDWLKDNWIFIIVAIGAIFCIYAEVKKFLNLNTDEQIASVKAWLLSAVCAAEKIYGSKTGQIKLSYVYGLFCDKFPKLVTIITFETFSSMVDEVLDNFRNMLESNDTLKAYVENTTTAQSN